jgi:alpha-L-rhamnosidase
MGLLEESDWLAKWISGDYKPKKKERYPVDCFKKDFQTKKEIKKARLYASARGLYDVCINGSRLTDFILAPGMTDYRKRIQYQTYDVTGLLQDKNTLELRLADGWYRGSSAAYGVTEVYGNQTSLIAQLEVIYTDGSKDVIATDGSFAWSNDGPIRFADNKDGEIYDAGREDFAKMLEKNHPIRGKQLRSRILPKTSRIYRHLVMWQYVKKRLFTPNF